MKVKHDLLITDKSTICHEILAYLLDHPEAQDTLEGIVNWWLLEQAIKFREGQVRKAIVELVNEGFVIEQRGSGLETCYRINQDRFEEIKKLVRLIGE